MSTFDGLFIARSGVRASRASLNVSGQNITNANTDGYTRQRVDQSSLPPPGENDFYANSGASYGSGVETTQTEQLRDEFLDEVYRTLNAKSGGSSTISDSLSDLENIFTTTTTSSSSSAYSTVDVLSDEFGKFISQLENITSSSDPSTESSIREEAKLVASRLNTAAKALDTSHSKQLSALDKNMSEVNDLLKNIASLNTQIKNADVSGIPALELQDQRNLMLDQLSQYASIRIDKTPEDAGSGRTVDNISVELADTNGNPLMGPENQPFKLIDGDEYAKFFTSDGPASAKTTSPYDYTAMRLSSLSKDGSSYTADAKLNEPVSFASPTSFNIYIDGEAPATVTINPGAYSSASALAAAMTISNPNIHVTASGSKLQFSSSDGSVIALDNTSVFGNDGSMTVNAAANASSVSASLSLPLSFSSDQSFRISLSNGEYSTVTVPAGAYASASALAAAATVTNPADRPGVVSISTSGNNVSFTSVPIVTKLSSTYKNLEDGLMTVNAASNASSFTAALSGVPATFTSDESFVINLDNGESSTVTVPAGTYTTAAGLASALRITNPADRPGVVSASAAGNNITFTSVDIITKFSATSQTFSSSDTVSLYGLQNSDLKTGGFSGSLEILNESGEYDTKSGNATTTSRGIGYYSQMLNSIANAFASVMNKANSTGDSDAINKPLFTSDGTNSSGITAQNIQIASNWKDGYLTTSKEPANASDSKASSYSNITNMVTELNEKMSLDNGPSGINIFKGTLVDAFSNVGISLGQDVSSCKSTSATDTGNKDAMDTKRQSLSSVSVDDEAISLVQYNQALSAASRFFTTVDQCIDTIINNMGKG